MEYITAFVIGGLICAAVQILLDRTKMMPGRVMVLLVCTGALLGFCGIYKPFQRQCTAARFRQCFVAGCKGSGGRVRIYRYLYGRIQSKCSGNNGGFDFRIYCILYIRTENEEMKEILTA